MYGNHSVPADLNKAVSRLSGIDYTCHINVIDMSESRNAGMMDPGFCCFLFRVERAKNFSHVLISSSDIIVGS